MGHRRPPSSSISYLQHHEACLPLAAFMYNKELESFIPACTGLINSNPFRKFNVPEPILISATNKSERKDLGKTKF